MNDPSFVVVGERVALGPVRADLAERYAAWLNHHEVKVGLLMLGVMTPESEREWIERAAREGAQPNPPTVNFTIYDRSDLSPVGTCGLKDIDHRNRRAEFGIFLGERRNRGLGTEAARLTLDFAFTVLSLNSVMLCANGWNTRAIRSYERAGFRHVGRRREAVLTLGRLHDEVIMDAIAGEFGASVLRPTESDPPAPPS